MLTTISDNQIKKVEIQELFLVIIKHKTAVLLITVIVTLFSGLYEWKPTRLYKGETLIEIGSVILNGELNNDKPTIIQTFEKPNDLAEIIIQMQLGKILDPKMFAIDIPNGSEKLVKISFQDTNKQQISKILKETITFIVNRHKMMETFYHYENARVRSTAVVGSISIKPVPAIVTKKLAISIGFAVGLILGIFTAFFLEFIRINRTNKL